MIENLYILYDKNAKIGLKPLLVHRNDVSPVREIEEVTANKETLIHKHAGDFQLLHVGTIDLETLQVSGLEPRVVAEAIDLLDDTDQTP